MPYPRRLIATGLLLAIGGPIAVHGAAAAETLARSSSAGFDAAAASVDAFHAALTRGDGRGALALLAGDVVIFEEGEVERSRDDYARAHLAADAAFAAATARTRTARRGAVDGDVAWVVTEGRTTGRFKGKSVDRISTETMVLKRILERSRPVWRIVHVHWSSRVPQTGMK